jgi:hypothetical protein
MILFLLICLLASVQHRHTTLTKARISERLMLAVRIRVLASTRVDY